MQQSFYSLHCTGPEDKADHDPDHPTGTAGTVTAPSV